MPKSKHGSGFTFIELLIIVVVIGILTGVAVPQIAKTADNFRLESFTKDIYYLCRYIQANAISEGRIYYLRVAPSEKSISVSYKDADAVFKPVPGRIARQRIVPEGISITSPPETSGIYFYPDAGTSELAITFENKYNRKMSVTTKGTAGAFKIE